MSVDENELKELRRRVGEYVGEKKTRKPLPAPIAALIGVPLAAGVTLGGLYLLVQIVKFAWH